MKDLLRKFFHFYGYDFRKFDYRTTYDFMIGELLKRSQVDLVLDIGANYGQYSLHLRKTGYKGRIISFEPLTTAWKVMEQRARKDSNWIAAPKMALGDFNGEIKMNVAGNSESSSFLNMHENHVLAEPSSRYVSVENVAIHRLDDYLSVNSLPGRHIFMKIDTQGAEAKVLAGADKTLHNTIGIELELSIKLLYEGQLLHEDMINLLAAKGFTLWSMYPGMVDNRTGRLLQYNGIFVRETYVQMTNH
jgi:FkbM family methyltransferase